MFTKIIKKLNLSSKLVETSVNEEVLLEHLKNKSPLIVREGLYADAFDMEYNRFGDAVFLTLYLNLSFTGELFLSSSKSNVKASIPVGLVFDYESSRSGFYREEMEKLGHFYYKELSEKLSKYELKHSVASSMSEIAVLVYSTDEEKEALLNAQ